MASNALDPSEWHSIVERIRDTNDPTVGARLAERESRFDNFFSYHEYTPELSQSAAATSLVVDSSRGQVTRIGHRVHVHFQIDPSAVGTGGQGVRVSPPPDLPVAGGDSFDAMISGTIIYNDQSSGINYLCTPYHVSNLIYLIADQGINVFGISPPITIAAADRLSGDFTYYTSATSLF